MLLFRSNCAIRKRNMVAVEKLELVTSQERFNMIDLTDGGLVYRNPKPHLKSIHAWHPSVAFFADGENGGGNNGSELVVSFDLAEAGESMDYRSHIVRSTDMGQAWSEPARIFHEELDRPTVHTARISRVPDGTLLAFGGRLYRDDPNEGFVNRDNLGYVPMDLILLESHDRGRNWQGPQTIEPPLVGPSFEVCHSIRELADGRWIAPVSTWKGWNGETPNGMNAYMLVSHDRGKTWPDYTTVMAAYDEGIIHWEQSVVQLADGRLLAVAWAVEEESGKTLPSPYAISDDGTSFTPSMPTGFHSQTTKMICLEDGRVLALYRRHDKHGLWANLVRIEGHKWINLESVSLWEGAVSGMDGEKPTGDELSNLKFGYPNMVQLPDGDVFVVFWCLEDCIYNIRWMRLKIQ